MTMQQAAMRTLMRAENTNISLDRSVFTRENFRRIKATRARLSESLEQLGFNVLPSQTNFVFIDLKAPLKPFADRMKTEHILVGRPFPPAVQWCRISLGTPAEMRYFVEKLKEFRQKGWV